MLPALRENHNLTRYFSPGNGGRNLDPERISALLQAISLAGCREKHGGRARFKYLQRLRGLAQFGLPIKVNHLPPLQEVSVPQEMEAAACPFDGEREERPIFFSTYNPVVGCPQCGSLRVSPQPTEQELQRLYYGNSQYYTNNNLPSPDRSLQPTDPRTAWAEHSVRKLIDEAAIGRGERLFEIGFGHGQMLLRLQSRGYLSHKQPCGLEMAANSVTNLAVRYGLNVVQANTTDLLAVTGKGSQDVIFAHSVFEHLKDPMQIFRLAYAALDTGGRLVVMGLENPFGLRTLIGGGVGAIFFSLEHLHFIPVPTAQKVLRSVGFSHIKTFNNSDDGRLQSPALYLADEIFPHQLGSRYYLLDQLLSDEQMVWLEGQLNFHASWQGLFTPKHDNILRKVQQALEEEVIFNNGGLDIFRIRRRLADLLLSPKAGSPKLTAEQFDQRWAEKIEDDPAYQMFWGTPGYVAFKS